ncbi:hypothetical protein RF11_15491 [Thelohanellus kitauei]|uniref:Uncharacterized protein n=1 Tax=Thelohanellus kitauei TaxID=669202 RepID=A0A0C2MUK8_THEKT|nr:hypothetical protein RF11_15491 [Thelohanellus kitauei]
MDAKNDVNFEIYLLNLIIYFGNNNETCELKNEHYETIYVNLNSTNLIYPCRTNQDKYTNQTEIYSSQDNQVKGFSYPDAGQAYFKAGDFSENQLQDFIRAKSCYMDSADCYRQVLSCSAYESYRKHVEVCLKKAIHRSFECGYIIATEFNDITKANEFYDLAEDIIPQTNFLHVCLLKPFYMKNFVTDEKIDFVINNLEEYMREVEWACAQYNHLADESLKKPPEERSAQNRIFE